MSSSGYLRRIKQVFYSKEKQAGLKIFPKYSIPEYNGARSRYSERNKVEHNSIILNYHLG